MKVFFHFSVEGFSNTYLIGPEEGGEAILIDPGKLDVPLLQLIESNGYTISSILITHAHEAHVRGVRTILKVYDAMLYGMSRTVCEHDCHKVVDGEEFSASGFPVRVIGLPGHSSDSAVYKIGMMLFTGDCLEAGRIGKTPHIYAQALLADSIKERLFSLGPGHLVFPGHGPPSTLEAEMRYNPDLNREYSFPEPKKKYIPFSP
jgi:hydroxyacylglutathione hydrolase